MNCYFVWWFWVCVWSITHYDDDLNSKLVIYYWKRTRRIIVFFEQGAFKWCANKSVVEAELKYKVWNHTTHDWTTNKEIKDSRVISRHWTVGVWKVFIIIILCREASAIGLIPKSTDNSRIFYSSSQKKEERRKHHKKLQVCNIFYWFCTRNTRKKNDSRRLIFFVFVQQFQIDSPPLLFKPCVDFILAKKREKHKKNWYDRDRLTLSSKYEEFK